jgi:hypothetical protein
LLAVPDRRTGALRYTQSVLQLVVRWIT